MRRKNRFITEMEHISFMKFLKEHTNDSVELFDGTIIQKDLLEPYIREVLVAYDSNRNHKIFGVDIMRGFEVALSSKEHIVKIAQNIWDNPEKYHDFHADGDGYSGFTKYLWISSSAGELDGKRLTDIVNINSDKV